ncbi:terminase gpP N-terminus-related DNA-binding protein [Phocaeicola faecicola]|uniref:terminase gpP N-terminus-related DNA-binding protein n=1 Tax=Phocaeicola faecicola TaxID=2739389 RepID=UPI002A805387|nr:DDE transposase family protein [Phocaeicola faecicola]MDY4872617.1 DDE transposase family protein [Phocaeicola faecicola]
MADLKSDQKKALARDIYLLGSFTYEEIAQKVGTQRQTISRWAKQGGWDDLKAGMSVTREEILKRLYQQLNNINAIILERDPKERFANSKEADAMAKLSATIKNMEIDVGISDIISVGMRFGEWLRRVDLDKAKEYVQYWDLFLKEQIK